MAEGIRSEKIGEERKVKKRKKGKDRTNNRKWEKWKKKRNDKNTKAEANFTYLGRYNE